ncbi:MAG: hypothetical protein OSB00_15870 [Sphingomonas bacterium]|nr:hypothetical protein [Sphingomonas bacterium]
MIAIGCLLLIVLPLLGMVAGALIAGPQGAKWGAFVGLTLTTLAAGFSTYAMAKIGRRS